MNLSPIWVPFLEAGGVSALHWMSVGPPTAPDLELMNWARVTVAESGTRVRVLPLGLDRT